jgi:hypothetical protein
MVLCTCQMHTGGKWFAEKYFTFAGTVRIWDLQSYQQLYAQRLLTDFMLSLAKCMHCALAR